MDMFYVKTIEEFDEIYFAKKNMLLQKKKLKKLSEKNNIPYLEENSFCDYDEKCVCDFASRPGWNALEKKIDDTKAILPDEPISIYMTSWEVFSADISHFIAKYVELMEKEINVIFFDNFTLCSEYISQFTELLKINSPTISLRDILRFQIPNEQCRKAYEFAKRSARIKEGHRKNGNMGGTTKRGPQLLTNELRNEIVKHMNAPIEKRNAAKICRKYNISRNTFTKYRKLIENEITPS